MTLAQEHWDSVPRAAATVGEISLSRGWKLCCSLLAGVLLGLPFLFPTLYLLGWVGFLPLLLALRGANAAQAYCLGLAAGLSFYLVVTPWVIDFLILFKGLDEGRSFFFALFIWVYSAQLMATLCLCFIWLRQSVVPDLLLFPTLVAVFHGFFPMLFRIELGESQSAFLTGMQGVAWTGVYGLDFLMALVATLLYRWVLHWRRIEKLPVPASAMALVALSGWMAYGLISLAQWDSAAQEWPVRTLGLVQSTDVPVLGPPPILPGFSLAYPPEMAMSERLAAAGAEFIVWPEGRYKRFFDDPRVQQAYGEAAASIGRPILLQDIEHVSEELRYNSVAILSGDGSVSAPYRKVKRVAFGEALPAEGIVPAVDAFLIRYFGSFLRGIEAGTERRLYPVGDFRILPLICYESLFPWFTAEGMPEDGRGVLLVTVSRDSWFGMSRQPYQHANSSTLRAVENRSPLVHVINDGPSTAILPNGRRVFESKLGQAGGFLVDLPFSTEVGGSFFSRYPAAFVSALFFALALAVLARLHARRSGRVDLS